MNRRFISLLIPLFFLAPRSLSAQTTAVPSIRLDRIPSELGLSQNLITCMMQDRKGFLWVGTKDGLNRFDGYEFVVYQYDAYDSTSLSDNFITSLMEDRAGRIWVGTQRGLNLFDRRAEVFHRLFPAAIPNGLLHPTIGANAIAEDEHGAIWIGTGNGLCRLTLPAAAKDFTGARITHYLHDPQNATSSFVNNVVIEDNGAIWLQTLTIQKLVVDAKSSRYTSVAFDCSLDDPLWQAVLEQPGAYRRLQKGRNGKIWIGVGPGLICWDARTQKFTRYRFWEQPTRAQYLWWRDVRGMAESRNGIVWIGMRQGLACFDPQTQTFTEPQHEPGSGENFPDQSLTEVLQDSAGLIWMGSNGYGLYRYDPNAERFNYRRANGKMTRWRGKSLRGICETREGDLWVGPIVLGLARLNRVTGELAPVSLPSGLSLGELLFSIMQDRKGALWLGAEKGLFRAVWRNHQLERVSYFDPEPDSTRVKYVYKVFEDRRGDIWITTKRNFCRLNQVAGTFESYPFLLSDNPAAESVSEHVFIHEDRNGDFWLGAAEGLLRFDAKQKTFARFRNDPQDRTSLSHNVVRAVVDDPFEPARYLWAGTAGGGLNRFDRQTETFIHFTEKDGLPDNVIYAILDDEDGNLWMSTNYGISKFNPRTHIFKNFDAHDGLQDNEFNSSSYFKSPAAGGELFFGGISGLNAFYPKDVRDNPHAPPVALTGFQIFNKPISHKMPNSPLAQAIAEAEEITLSHEHKVFSFEFAALDFTAPAKNQYAYKMENFDADWQQTGTKRLATYTNLDPGKYVFRVKGSNNDGVWNETGVSIKITITPPWWQTWWAYTLYVLFFAASLYTLHRYERNRQQLKHQVEIERLQTEKQHLETTKLQELDHLKSRFFANISHEFRTPLTLILGPAEQEIEQAEEGRLKRNLLLIKSNAQRLLRLINQLLDLSRLESKKMELQVRRGDLVEFLKGLTMSFASLAERKNLTLQFFAPVEKLEAYFDQDKMEKIFYNLLSNAFKFTPEGGEVSVQLSVASDQSSVTSDQLSVISKQSRHKQLNTVHCLLITVTDTGIGISSDRLQHIFDRFYQVDSSSTREYEGTGIGLALVKELVELHHGAISVTSEIGKGATFTVQLPLGKEHLRPEEIIATAVKATRVVSTIDELPVISDQLSVTSDQSSVISGEQRATSDETLILIVEDHADFRQFMRSHLEPEYKIIEAANGAEGWEKALATIPDLVISDVMMPRMNGYELCAKLKTDERTSHIPVILLTAKAGSEDKISGLQTGADDYLSKPFDAKELQARIKNLIALRQKLKERFSTTMWVKPSEVTSQCGALDQKFLERVTASVEANLAEEDFGVEQLCRAAGMSERQLQRKLKALVEQSPTNFIRGLRLRRALQLLEQNAGTVSEIAFQVGFNNLSYFTRAFREAFSKLPSEVRGEG